MCRISIHEKFSSDVTPPDSIRISATFPIIPFNFFSLKS
jgi:hypothetical protein